MEVRPVFAGMLAVTVVGTAGVLALAHTRQAQDRADLHSATVAARQVSLPAQATASRECHGDGLVLCFTAAAPTNEIAAALARELGVAAGKPARVHCSRVSHGAATGQDTCLVAVRWRHRGAFAFVSPHVVRGASGPEVDGVLVSVAAS